MKIDPVDFILDCENKLNKQFYFVAGNEHTLINKIKDVVVNNYKKKHDYYFVEGKLVNEKKIETSLFNEKTCYLYTDPTNLDEDVVESLLDTKDVFLFVFNNSPKAKSFKKIFINRADSYVIECFSLVRQTKVKIVNYWLNNRNIKIDEQNYWYLIDRLSDKYTLLEKELGKLEALDSRDINQDSIKYSLMSLRTIEL